MRTRSRDRRLDAGARCAGGEAWRRGIGRGECMTELTASVDASLTGIPPGIAARTGLNTLRDFFRRYGFVIAAYIVATFSTSAIFMGDTVDYVESITLWSRGVNHNFWEFAHLLWRPLGWVTSSLLSPITSLFVGPSQRLNVTLTLITISWLAGAVCVVQIHSLARRVSGRTLVANFVAFAFICTQGFLNFAQAGNSYIAGLALLLLGIQILSFPGKLSHAARSVLAGAALAGAVLIWVNYLFAIPAALVAPLFLVAFDRKCMRLVLRTAIVFSLITGLAYAAVIAGMKLHTVDQVRTWIAASSAGTDFSGVKRAIFGLARSFINMGNDGLLFKRYLLHDPYNPVSLRVLIGAALWKLALFYSFAASVVMSLLYSRQ